MANATVCQECGTALPADGECWSRVNELLEIETRALAPLDPEAARRAHFFAIATYQLQHPSRLTLPTLQHLRANVVEMLAPHPRPIEAMRRDVARATGGSQRVTRRAPFGDRSHVPNWPRQWTMTIVDIVSAPDDAYSPRVAQWAQASLRDIARAEATWSCRQDAAVNLKVQHETRNPGEMESSAEQCGSKACGYSCGDPCARSMAIWLRRLYDQ